MVMVDPTGQVALEVIALTARCAASRPCRAVVTCIGAAVGRGLYELVKHILDGNCCDWCKIGCKSLCACATAGLGSLIPKDLLISIFGTAFGSALTCPACTDACDRMCSDKERH